LKGQTNPYAETPHKQKENTNMTRTNSFSQLNISGIKNIIKENVGLAYTTIGGLGFSVLGALFWLILASILNVDNYGQVNYYIATASVAAGVGIIGLNMTLTTYLAKGEKNLLYEANSFTLITGVASALFLSAFHWAAGILAATSIFFSMTQAELLGTKKYRQYALISIGQKTAQLVLSLLLYYPFGIIGVIFGYFLGALLFSYKYLHSIIKNFTLNFSTLKQKRNFTLHSYGYNLIGKNLANYLDKMIIGTLFGYYALGLYQLGFQFFMFFSIIPSSLYQYLLPEESSGNNKHQIKTIGLLTSIALAITAYIASPHLISNLFPTFVDSIPLVQIMSIAVIPQTVVAILTASHLGQEKSKTVFIAGLIYIAALIAGIIALKQIMGVLGFAAALILAQTIQATYLLINKNQ
jgi:O-antigen/teichoic acid export membrane protein